MIATSTPVGPRGRLIVGNLPEIRRDILGALAHAASYGDVSRLRLLNRSLYLLNHPDFVKQVLVDNHRNYVKGRALGAARPVIGNGLLTSEGEFHQRQRRLIQPAFHRQQITGYAQVMSEYTAEQISQWNDGDSLDLHEEMMALTMAIVAKVLFDMDVRSETSAVGGALQRLFDDFSFSDASPLSEFISYLPLPRNRRRADNRQILDNLIYSIIRQRRNSSEDRHDALSMILSASESESKNGGMSDQQVRDEVMTLFIAGHETTANALSWTFYLLMQHPDTGQKLTEELARVLGDRPPTMNDLQDLAYTRMVFSEALRLYPPAWGITRTALHDDTVGDYRIPSGSTVVVSPYLLHHDPRFWDHPNTFMPDRFAEEAPPDRPRYAYFPFGGGPRLCIGEPFAWVEGELLLASIWQRYAFRLQPGARVEPEPLITLRLKYGLPVRVVRRG